MTPAELRAIGERHGHGWQTRLANGLEVDSRTIRRWLAGETKINRGMELLIRKTLEEWDNAQS